MRVWAAGALLASFAALACSPAAERSDAAAPSAGGASSAASGISAFDQVPWVTIYDPERAANGFTLAFYRRRIPILMDMNGTIVHAWPGARVSSRLRLLEDGSLLGLALGRAVLEYDWDGNLVWEHRLGEKLPHHDVIRLANGNTMLPVLPGDGEIDELLEIDRAGRVVWEWRAGEHLGDHLGKAGKRRRDLTHINSIQELPANPWHDRGDERFRPGNLLVSARNLNAIFVIDKSTKEVVWLYDRRLDMQHEALMIGPGFPGHGNILVFNNGYRHRYHYRQSTILEIDPGAESLLWEYRSEDFYSPTEGVEQPLANGNVLVTSSRSRRVFEITRGGEIVWQWTPPFETLRTLRYPYDHCPQLEALGEPKQEPVRPPAGYRYVDTRVYRFGRGSDVRKRVIAGEQRQILKARDACSELLVPAQATLGLAYGLDRERLPAAAGHAARFTLRLRPRGAPREVELLRDTVDSGAELWRGRTIPLDEYAFEWVQICVETEELPPADGKAAGRYAFWANPAIRVRAPEEEQRGGEEDLLGDLTEEEAEARRQHLRALGYVN